MSPNPNTHTPPPAFVTKSKPANSSTEFPEKRKKWKVYVVVLGLIALVLALGGVIFALSTDEGNAPHPPPVAPVE